VKLSGRQTMGVRLMNLASGDSVVAIARNAESLDGADADSLDEPGEGPEAGEALEAGEVPEAEDVPETAEDHGEMTTGPGDATS
jgi:hypothetical protein